MSWVKCHGGNIPENALIAGYEADGARALYIGRAAHNGGVHIGKAGKHLKGCNIGWGGNEVTVPDFEVFVVTAKQGAHVHWKKKKAGKAPANAMPAGSEADGRPLWISRAKHGDGLHIGKTGAHLNGCNYGFGGKEHNSNTYEVLTFVDKLI